MTVPNSATPAAVDELSALLESRSWVLRRVDRLEFVDLTSVRRTIVFTLDLVKLRACLPRSARAFPLGLFRRDAVRAGARLVDATSEVIPHLTRPASDDLVADALKQRLSRFPRLKAQLDVIPGVTAVDDLLDPIKGHSPTWCAELADHDGFDGYSDLAAEKWGCPAAGQLLRCLRGSNLESTHPTELAEVVRLLFDWQNNFVLFVPCEPGELPASLATLEFSYDEELQAWQTPWDRRMLAIKNNDLGKGAQAEREHIARPPFDDDLDALRPRSAWGWVATRSWLWVRRLGRRGALRIAWHVAWQQASSQDVGFHVVEVTLPSELAVIRMRMIEATLRTNQGEKAERRERVVAARLGSGRDATLFAPQRGPGGPPAELLSEMFMSLVVAQKQGPGAWLAAGMVALGTGLVVVVAALTQMPQLVAQASTAVTILLLAPALVSALLSVRAASDIAQELILSLRTLIALIGVLTVACAIGLMLQPSMSAVHHAGHLVASGPNVTGLRAEWLVCGGLLLLVCASLLLGHYKLDRRLDYRDTLPRDPDRVANRGTALTATVPGCKAPRIPPPDRWLETGEGDRVPWGWLWFDPASSYNLESGRPPDTRRRQEDQRYWSVAYPEASDQARADLIAWRTQLFTRPPPRGRPGAPRRQPDRLRSRP